MNARAQGTRKSQFPGRTSVPSDAYVDFFENGVNYKIPFTDFLQSLTVTGEIKQAGNPTGVPVLDKQGAENLIRNIIQGPGVKASVTPQNGLKLENNYLRNTRGINVLQNPTESQPTLVSLVEGTGVSLAYEDGAVVVSTSGTLPATKVVPVNSIQDFPQPEAGVITLEPGTIYLLSNNIVTDNRFVIRPGTAVRGYSSISPTLEYTGTDTMFTAFTADFIMEDISVKCSNGALFKVESDCTATLSRVTASCKSIGQFSEMIGFSMSGCAISDFEEGMRFFDSVTLEYLSFNRSSFIAGTATASGNAVIDLDSQSVRTNNFECSTCFLSGNSAWVALKIYNENIKQTQIGTVINTRFLSGIMPVFGIIPNAPGSFRWTFNQNSGLEDTRYSAYGYINSNVGVTQITAANTPAKANVNNVFERLNESAFSISEQGVITYHGEKPYRAIITATVAMKRTSGFFDRRMSALFAFGGVPEPASATEASGSENATGSATVIWPYEFINGDHVEVFVENLQDDSNITCPSIHINVS